jgi:hypothetical protein
MGPQLLFPPGAGLVLEQVRLCGEIVRLLACCAAAGADYRVTPRHASCGGLGVSSRF